MKIMVENELYYSKDLVKLLKLRKQSFLLFNTTIISWNQHHMNSVIQNEKITLSDSVSNRFYYFIA